MKATIIECSWCNTPIMEAEAYQEIVSGEIYCFECWERHNPGTQRPKVLYCKECGRGLPFLPPGQKVEVCVDCLEAAREPSAIESALELYAELAGMHDEGSEGGGG